MTESASSSSSSQDQPQPDVIALSPDLAPAVPGADPEKPLHQRPDPAMTEAISVWRSVVPLLAGSPHIRVSRDGGRNYPKRKHPDPLPADPPRSQPCTIPVYDRDAGTGRVLALDLDTKRADSSDPAEQVTVEAAALTALIERLGGQAITDVSPGGGRHVFVRFAEPRPWRDLYEIARALGRRFPAVDSVPIAGPAAQISPPGSRHKSGGWRVLTMPLNAARAAAEHPCGADVWDGLQRELAAELAADRPRSRCIDDPGAAALPDELANPFGLPALRKLSTSLERIARSGRWRPAGYRTSSEARMAIVTSASARGWSLAEIRAKAESGEWSGLAELYARPREPGRIDRLLPYEFSKAVAWGEKSAPLRHKRPKPPPGGSEEPGDFAEEAIFGEIRRWLTATDVAVEDRARVTGWGQAAVSVRKILIAIGLAAMVSGSPVIEFGCRNIGLQAGVSSDTAARDLRMLREENDPLIELVRSHIFGNADRYRLRIPAAYEASVQWRRRRAGRVEAIHPVFIGGGGLGGAVGLVYQALTGTHERAVEVARVARLSESTVSSALRSLAEYGLAEHRPGGWRRGDVDPAAVAEVTGAADLYRARAAGYADDRRVWKLWVAEYLGRPREVRTEADDGYFGLNDRYEYEQLALMTTTEAGRAPPVPMTV